MGTRGVPLGLEDDHLMWHPRPLSPKQLKSRLYIISRQSEAYTFDKSAPNSHFRRLVDGL